MIRVHFIITYAMCGISGINCFEWYVYSYS